MTESDNSSSPVTAARSQAATVSCLEPAAATSLVPASPFPTIVPSPHAKGSYLNKKGEYFPDVSQPVAESGTETCPRPQIFTCRTLYYDVSGLLLSHLKLCFLEHGHFLPQWSSQLGWGHQSPERTGLVRIADKVSELRSEPDGTHS